MSRAKLDLLSRQVKEHKTKISSMQSTLSDMGKALGRLSGIVSVLVVQSRILQGKGYITDEDYAADKGSETADSQGDNNPTNETEVQSEGSGSGDNSVSSPE